MSYLLLTGSTGLLGSYLLRDALVARTPVVVIVRSQGRRSAATRTEELLQFWEAQLHRTLPRPVVLEGDLHAPMVGVGGDDLDWLSRSCSAAIHCAARVSFDEDATAGEPNRTNVEGVRNVLQLCEAAEIRNLFHVSTAYVAGSTRGRVRESEPAGRHGFSNEYERTKAVGESLVREAKFLHSATILRPSIVVGDSQSGFAPAFHGIYAPLRLGFLHLLAKLREGWTLEESLVRDVVGGQFVDRLGLSGRERKNLVPVDWVSRSILAAVNAPSAAGGAIHLTNAHPVSIAELATSMIAAALRFLQTNGVTRPGIPQALSDAAGFREHMQVFRSYLGDDPEFAAEAIARIRGATPAPQLDQEALVRLWDWAIRTDFYWRLPAAAAPPVDVATRFRHLLAATHDSASLHFEVTGPGGGGWRLAIEQGRPVAAENGSPAGLPRVVVSSQTLAELLTGRLQLEAAIDACRVAAFGQDARRIVAMHLPALIDWLASEQVPAKITRLSQRA